MEVLLDCLPCLLRQTLEAAKISTDDAEKHQAIIIEALGLMADFQNYKNSPDICKAMHRIVKRHTGVHDPYRDIKRQDIETAYKLYPLLERFFNKQADKLYWALKVSATGNNLDAAVGLDLDLEACIERELAKLFTICDEPRFREKFAHAKSLLIIGDNAGETVFDRLLIRELQPLDVTYAVRHAPVLNDAVTNDAIASGLDRHAHIISSGCSAPGTILEECSDEFLKIFNNADLVISKGQGNFESLAGFDREVYFLLKAKCPVIAHAFNVSVGDYIFKSST